MLLGALGGETRRRSWSATRSAGRSTARLGLPDDGYTAIVEVAQASGSRWWPRTSATPRRRPRRDRRADRRGGAPRRADGPRRRRRQRDDRRRRRRDRRDRGAGGLRGARLVLLCDVQTPFEDAPRCSGRRRAPTRPPSAPEARLAAQAAALPRDPRGVPMTGAAGGLAGGLWATYDAQLRPGAAFVLDAVSFDERLAACDAVVYRRGPRRCADARRQDRRRDRQPGA